MPNVCYEKLAPGKKKTECQENILLTLQNGLTHSRQLSLSSPLVLQWTAPANPEGHLRFL